MNDEALAKLPIGAVERETGLSKDLLRAWERRYGFPKPQRDTNNDRVYTSKQVQRLQLIKRLLDQGGRPSKIVPLAVTELQQRLAEAAPMLEQDRELLELLQKADPQAVTQYLKHRLATQGLEQFVTETLVACNRLVSEGWMAGRLSIHHEHLYTEHVQAVLRQAMSSLPSPQQRPRILLTTLPGEQHGLGLLMVQTMLLLEGAQVYSFGLQMPLSEIAAATSRCQADVAALSFSAAFSPSIAVESLSALRELLPPQVAIWAGGSGTRALRRTPEGVELVCPLQEAVRRVRAWRRDNEAGDEQ